MEIKLIANQIESATEITLIFVSTSIHTFGLKKSGHPETWRPVYMICMRNEIAGLSDYYVLIVIFNLSAFVRAFIYSNNVFFSS